MDPIQIDFSKLNLSLQPHVMAAIMRLNDDSDSNFSELERLIKSDQNLTGFIMKASNSPLYSRGNEIRNLQHAISLLGFRVIRSLASAAGSKQLFETGNYSRFKKYVWQHSVASAVVAVNLMEMTNNKDLREEAFVATLLHDIGKVVLNAVDRKKYIEVINTVETGGVTFSEAESRIFGTNHMETGARAATEWNLPAIFHRILGNHENNSDEALTDLSERDKKIFMTASAGNYIANHTGYGIPDETDQNFVFRSLSDLGISTDSMDSFMNSIGAKIETDEFYRFFITLI